MVLYQNKFMISLTYSQYNKKSLLVALLFFFAMLIAAAQEKNLKWDNTATSKWSDDFIHVQITSSIDSLDQQAWFYKTKKIAPQPLIISLHTWSGDYNQEDPLAKEILLRDWNYIHPDFRGQNNKPDACGSELVLSDIEDAIQYAVKNGNVDTTNVHIIGVSGGGYAAMLAYMKINYPVKSFNAWVGISNLVDWYYQSKGRKAKYADDLEKVATRNGEIDWEVLEKRSPLLLPFPKAKRINATMHIYAGIHDGYTGSVPITHSISFYNKIASQLFPEANENLVADSTTISLVTMQMNPLADTTMKLNGRSIHLQKEVKGLHLTVFEGGHEMLVSSALVLPPIDENKNLEPLQILTIGDSNGAAEDGWPNQLQKLVPFSTVINKSISGNTIGFDNLGQTKLNTLTNIERYLDETYQSLLPGKKLAYIFIGLGTNDTKEIFKNNQKDVARNMTSLISFIKNYHSTHQMVLPAICIITPPPLDEKMADPLKYAHSDERIRNNNKVFQKIAKEQQIGFIDCYKELVDGFKEKTKDGVHLKETAQFQLASIILNYINH